MRTARTAVLASATALTLALAACGGDDDEGGGDGEQQTTGGEFSTYIGEPQNPLIPSDTNETEGGQVVDSLFTGLIQYNNETYEPEFTGVAESIESEDQQTWTVKLKEGWTFHDGTPVTANSFVDAWNWASVGTNAQDNSYFFANIEGFDDVQGDVEITEEGEVVVHEEPKTDKMSGLKVVDDTTFEVTLSEPFAIWPMTVGYTAFFPLPESFFDDPEAFGEQPVGNGPWQANEPFVPGQGITLDKYPEYAGDDAANADRVELRVYTDDDTGYNDTLNGTLDIDDTLPNSALSTAADDFGDRFIESERGDITNLGFPLYLKEFQDPKVRQAFSMAIDREALTEEILQGSAIPASSFGSPVVNGYREGACGANVEFDPEAAKALLAETNFPVDKPLHIWFNSGAGHEEWTEALANQLTENLGIADYKMDGIDFADLLDKRTNGALTGPFRHGWVMDYPAIQNFLGPLYTSEALPPGGSNDVFYENPEFDKLVADADKAADAEEAIELYQQAEDILCEDLPAVPLFHEVNQLVHSEKVDNVIINGFNRIELSEVTVTQ